MVGDSAKLKVKAHRALGREGKVQVQVERGARYVQLTLTDTGVGNPSDPIDPQREHETY